MKTSTLIALGGAAILLGAFLVVQSGLYRYIYLPPCGEWFLWVQMPKCD